MVRCSVRVVIILLSAVALALPARPQDRISLTPQPIDVSISDLTQNPRTFRGRLVRVWGVPAMGWEGDNFLREWPEQNKVARRELWFYPAPGRGLEIFGELDHLNVRGRVVLFVFTGIFHLVPGRTREHEVFDRGPYELEVISARPWAVPTLPRSSN